MVYGNKERSLDGLFTIDAWHAKFDDQTREADLHVHVNFNMAQMGGDEPSPISFELRLRRATVVAVLPPTEEGFEIDPSSLFRAKPTAVESTDTTSSFTEKDGELNAKASIADASAGISGKLSKKQSHEFSTSIKGTVNSIIMRDGKTEDGNYCWHLEPQNETVLDGTPWDVNTQPLLKFKDKRSDNQRDLDIRNNMTTPVFIEVRCRRVDLEINLEPKDKSFAEKLINQLPGERDKRIAAAESYIRDELARQGLFHDSDLSEKNKYYRITLANTMANA